MSELTFNRNECKGADVAYSPASLRVCQLPVREITADLRDPVCEYLCVHIVEDHSVFKPCMRHVCRCFYHQREKLTNLSL